MSPAVADVWGHWQARHPHGSRYRLDTGRVRLIAAALKVRDGDACKRAIDGLFMSSYHVENGFLDVKYALRGGGQSPKADATIDRMGEIAAGQVSTGTNGRNGRHELTELEAQQIAAFDRLVGNGG